MALIELVDTIYDDGYLTLKPQMWFRRSENSNQTPAITEEDVRRIISESDKYVQSGLLEKEGKLVLNIENGETTEIDLGTLTTEPLTKEEVEAALDNKTTKE